MTTEEMLEQRHTLKLVWVEPWKACGPEGNELDAHIELRATVHDCVNMSRAAAKQAGRPTMGEDARHLLDFMAVHWAVAERPRSDRRREPNQETRSINEYQSTPDAGQ